MEITLVLLHRIIMLREHDVVHIHFTFISLLILFLFVSIKHNIRKFIALTPPAQPTELDPSINNAQFL